MIVRSANTADVPTIRKLVDTYSPDRRLLSKPTVALYEDVPEFVVAERDGRVIGCGALHVMWDDLAEVRTLAVDPLHAGSGVGGAILRELLERAGNFGVGRVFVLTFEVGFFAAFGFAEIEGTPVSHEVFEQLLQSYDEGVAEFLDLERVKPNTLGNSRLLLVLGD
jgi:amino-acid N-acetyltransferase